MGKLVLESPPQLHSILQGCLLPCSIETRAQTRRLVPLGAACLLTPLDRFHETKSSCDNCSLILFVKLKPPFLGDTSCWFKGSRASSSLSIDLVKFFKLWSLVDNRFYCPLKSAGARNLQRWEIFQLKRHVVCAPNNFRWQLRIVSPQKLQELALHVEYFDCRYIASITAVIAMQYCRTRKTFPTKRSNVKGTAKILSLSDAPLYFDAALKTRCSFSIYLRCSLGDAESTTVDHS